MAVLQEGGGAFGMWLLQSLFRGHNYQKEFVMNSCKYELKEFSILCNVRMEVLNLPLSEAPIELFTFTNLITDVLNYFVCFSYTGMCSNGEGGQASREFFSVVMWWALLIKLSINVLLVN